ncbi:DedA family protein [Actinomadura sp. HBU206391]|uniref:DedA family protein n=1 Tax=Actinomadura sp. HBU206391 TaxID=2731692 RepID=UPI00164F6927|nr:DedA family protein [Actinomadura sp. HBU206391]MBC6462833.1 DedA family protein [Actinomadura sp. HBU206391]
MIVRTFAHVTATEPAGGFAAWATHLMETLGAPGAGIAVALENLFPPLPSEVILPLAGFTAAQGDMNLLSAIFWTTLGSVVGAVALYYVGALVGRDRALALAARLPLVKVADLERTEKWFARHGVKTVFFGRMIPIFRSLISIPAGAERMPMITFVAFTALGSLIWNTTFVLAGYALGDNWHRAEKYAGVFQYVVVAAVAVAVAWFVVARTARARRAPRDRRDGRDRDERDRRDAGRSPGHRARR